MARPNDYDYSNPQDTYAIGRSYAAAEREHLRAENEAMRRLLGRLVPGEKDVNRESLLEERRRILAAET